MGIAFFNHDPGIWIQGFDHFTVHLNIIFLSPENKIHRLFYPWLQGIICQEPGHYPQRRLRKGGSAHLHDFSPVSFINFFQIISRFLFILLRRIHKIFKDKINRCMDHALNLRPVKIHCPVQKKLLDLQSRMFGKSHRKNSPHRQSDDQFKAGKPSVLEDRKSTRLNSSHVSISYAVFCLKKKEDADEEWLAQLESLWSAHAEAIEAGDEARRV